VVAGMFKNKLPNTYSDLTDKMSDKVKDVEF